jgi:hypothetical protein
VRRIRKFEWANECIFVFLNACSFEVDKRITDGYKQREKQTFCSRQTEHWKDNIFAVKMRPRFRGKGPVSATIQEKAL